MTEVVEAQDRVNQRIDLISCDQEPIHTPGAIQPQGVLLVARHDDFTITHASKNLTDFLGLPPGAALGQSLHQVLGEHACSAVRRALANERYAPCAVLAVDVPTAPFRLRMVAHATNRLVYIELEASPPSPTEGLAIQRTQAIMHALHAASSQRELCDIVVAKLRDLTGYDRVMVYRFDREGNGEVIAESLEGDLEPFLGLRYPASDIPPQARRMYLAQRVRTIADVDYVPVPILTDPALGQLPPLDMTLCALRSVSPMHLEYMRNMGTCASLGISLIPGTSLWGMLVCHHRSPLVITADLRAQCDLIGQLMSLLLGSVGEMETYAEQLLRQRKLHEIIARMGESEQVAEAFLASGDVVLSMLDASGAVIKLGDRTVTLGLTPPIEAASRAMTALNAASGGSLVTVDTLRECVPEWSTESAIASGALYLPLPPNANDGIIWFRPEIERLVKWAGDPNKTVDSDPATGRLSPRRSFAAWSERMEGHSAPWQEADRAIARELQSTIATAVAKQAVTTAQNETRVLLDNADQGFMSVADDLFVQGRSSAACENILGGAPGGRPLIDLLCQGDPKELEVRATFESIFRDSSDFIRELKIGLLPASLCIGGKFIHLSYKWLPERRRLMLILTDASETTLLTTAIEHEHQRLEMIVLAVTETRAMAGLVADYKNFILRELPGLLDGIDEPSIPAVLFRHLHTFKGLLAQFSFQGSPKTLHDMESKLSATTKWTVPTARAAFAPDMLMIELRRDLERVTDVLGPDFIQAGYVVILPLSRLQEMEAVAREALARDTSPSGTSALGQLLQSLVDLTLLDVKQALALHSRATTSLATRLHKQLEPNLIGGDDVKLPRDVYGAFFRSLVHVFRNAVDHGIEEPEERLQAHKPAAGSIRCDVSQQGAWINLIIADDGRGLDRRALEDKLIAAGQERPQVEKMSLEDLVFLEGLSSRSTANEVSGRGVGMSAVKIELDKLGGSVAIETELGLGTRLRFRVPATSAATISDCKDVT